MPFLAKFPKVTGSDLIYLLCKQSEQEAFTIGLLGGQKGVAERCAERLRKLHPNLNINFISQGGNISWDGRMSSEAENDLKLTKVDILFVAFGHIKQEKWIQNYKDSVNAKVFIGVGGAFDYISGKIPRAPKFLRDLGLEWFFRVMVEPWRLKRFIKLLKFLFLVLK